MNTTEYKVELDTMFQDLLESWSKIIYVAEYSYLQDCFNITTLEDSVAINLDMFKIKATNDYQILGLFSNYENALEFVEKLKKEK